ncbi:hypothetical protein APY94_09485 [Thermococcus celericrescens]|uniref:Uncharacterized protein n=1 Tax=Thermococcus celericrescens TaxID=227598 RepID=A0A100XWK5_9EURY|nr:hypothetical protein APY94_09485 [Thermococcus celericrescens]
MGSRRGCGLHAPLAERTPRLLPGDSLPHGAGTPLRRGKNPLTPDDYDLKSVSDSGLVVLSEKDRAFVFKEGERILTFNTSRVIAYRDKLLVSKDGKLKVFSEDGKLLTEGNYPFDQTILLR